MFIAVPGHVRAMQVPRVTAVTNQARLGAAESARAIAPYPEAAFSYRELGMDARLRSSFRALAKEMAANTRRCAASGTIIPSVSSFRRPRIPTHVSRIVNSALYVTDRGWFCWLSLFGPARQ